jgi:nucleotide-binding universal stress UspA family protein
MSDGAIFLLILIGWLTIGIGTAVVLQRRGHGLFGWSLLGALFGPLVVGMAIQAARGERDSRPRRVASGTPGRGGIDVLVGVDGSSESRAALRAAVELFGERIGRLSVATVVDYDAAETGRPCEELEAARRHLDEAAALVSPLRPETLVLAGVPAQALDEYAVEQGFDVIAIGHRGAGRAERLLGSVATRMARDGSVPVLMGGAVSDRRHSRPAVRAVSASDAGLTFPRR